MPFTFDPEVGAALMAIVGDNPPPPIPAGDVQSRRQMLDGLGMVLAGQVPKVEDVDRKDFTTKAEDGHEIKLRWYTKRDSNPGSAFVYTHGGGYIALTPDHYEAAVKRYVSRSGVPFLVVNYRLSPEVKAPTHVHDAYAALKYLVDHAKELGVDANRIGIMGDSAGGGITASLAHYIKSKGGPAVKKQILVYPMLDDRNLGEHPDIAPYATWSSDDNKTAWEVILGDKLGKDDVGPVEAAGRATVEDLKGLPPTYIDVGEVDIFRDEDMEYARKLGQAGVECELHVFPGANHAFQDIAPDSYVGRTALEARFRAIKTI